jgi:hypothetical protein
MAAPILAPSKPCSKCRVVKPLAEFCRRGPSDTSYYCRACTAAARRKGRPAPSGACPPEPYADDPLSWTRVIFRHVRGFPGYGVDTLGNVWSCMKAGGRGSWATRVDSRWRILKPADCTSGYPIVHLCAGGKHKSFSCHRLVLEAFVGPRPAGMAACHGNGNRADNRLCNLRWDTHAANVADSFRHGRRGPGSRCHNAKLREENIPEIRAMIARRVPFREIGTLFGVSRATIKNVSVGRNWTHVPL